MVCFQDVGQDFSRLVRLDEAWDSVFKDNPPRVCRARGKQWQWWQAPALRLVAVTDRRCVWVSRAARGNELLHDNGQRRAPRSYENLPLRQQEDVSENDLAHILSVLCREVGHGWTARSNEHPAADSLCHGLHQLKGEPTVAGHEQRALTGSSCSNAHLVRIRG